MRSERKLVHLTFIIILFLGCTNSETTNHRIVKKVIGEDKDIVYCVTNADTVRDGLCLHLDSTGRLVGLYSYKEGREHGVEKFFYPNGQVSLIRNFNNGKREGEHWQFFKNGTLDVYVRHVNGEYPIGSVYYYYPSGELSRYEFWNADSDLVYAEKYHEDGRLAWTQGSTLSNISFRDNMSYTFTRDGVICAKCLTARLPGARSVVRLEVNGREHPVSRKGDYIYFCWEEKHRNRDTLLITNEVYQYQIDFPDFSDTIVVFGEYLNRLVDEPVSDSLESIKERLSK